MPFPLMAAASLAAIAGNLDCDQNVAQILEDDEKKTDEAKQSLRFDESGDLISEGVRSVAVEQQPSSPFFTTNKNGSIQLGRSPYSKKRSISAPTTSLGYKDGLFASGVTHEIHLEEGCFVLTYSDDNLLAIGTQDGLELWETKNYTRVFHLPTKDEVSAIQWLNVDSNLLPSQRLLAFGCLDGTFFLYLVDGELLEVDGGVSLVHTFRMKGQIRAMDCCTFGYSHDATITIVLGDSTGALEMVSLDESLQHTNTMCCETFASAVVGVSIHKEQEWIAVCTKNGHVTVNEMKRDFVAGPVTLGNRIWETRREGSVLAVTFSHSGGHLALGGYGKTVDLIDTSVWGLFRTLKLEGTVNVISFDHLDRYIAVGCRDRSMTLFDSSTYMRIKNFHTEGWVTDISWKGNGDTLALRSKRHVVSILDLQPIERTNIQLFAQHGLDCSLAWSADGNYLIRSVGKEIILVGVDQDFDALARMTFIATVTKVQFCLTPGMNDMVAVVDESGRLSLVRVLPAEKSGVTLETQASAIIEEGIKAISWSPDGSLIAAGGKQKRLRLVSASTLVDIQSPIDLEGRVWDLVFANQNENDEDVFLVLALGNYTCVALNKDFEMTLRLSRPRTVRCVALHPHMPLLAVGDGAGTLAFVDTAAAELVHEIDVSGGGRVNCVDFSPMGDYLVAGFDSGTFNLYNLNAEAIQFAQEIYCAGFAICCQFKRDGGHLALGSAGGSYSIVRLGPFLGIDLVPLSLQGGTELPSWALAEVLYRSGNSPSFLQRHIQAGGSNDIKRLATMLKLYPSAVYTFDRSTNETFFDTALRIRRPLLLKLAITALVDGTLDSSHDQSILTTRLPEQAKYAIVDMIVNMSSDFVSEILREMKFHKVPLGMMRSMKTQSKLETGSPSFADPWGKNADKEDIDPLDKLKWSDEPKEHEKMLTPAVLPLPGLGEMGFLSVLLWNAPPDVFNNAAMGVVLHVLWRDHIRKLFYADFLLFICFYGCWIALVESIVSNETWNSAPHQPTKGLSIVIFLFNSLFATKELIEAKTGKVAGYYKSFWNVADVISILFVYTFVLHQLLPGDSEHVAVPLAVTTSLLLTIQFICYLRAFDGTGWLISVLSANFTDVRGFLFILFAILVGFAVAFRVLLSQVNGDGFGSLRRSFLSTFELVTTGSYETSMLYEAEWSVLAVFTFVLAVTCVLVIALNALISILADSYARVQENAVANRRREQAGLIIEYMSILPAKSRKNIEEKTKWIHCLLEVDSDGMLVLGKQDWQGGLNALRKDIEEISSEAREQQEKSLLQLKNELNSELQAFRKETSKLLASLAAEVKELKKVQSRGGITINGKNVVNAVKAVKSIGKKIIKKDENTKQELPPKED